MAIEPRRSATSKVLPTSRHHSVGTTAPSSMTRARIVWASEELASGSTAASATDASRTSVVMRIVASLPASFVPHGEDILRCEADPAGGQFLAVPGQFLNCGQSGRPVVDSFRDQTGDRLAVTRDDDLLPSFDAVDHFGQPGLGIIGADRCNRLRGDLIHNPI